MVPTLRLARVRSAGRLAAWRGRPRAGPSGGGGPESAAPAAPADAQPDPSLVMPRLEVTADTAVPAPPPLRVLRQPSPNAKPAKDSNFWGKMSVLALAVRERRKKGWMRFCLAPACLPPNALNPSPSLSSLSPQATLISERVTGSGAIQALDLAVGVPIWEIDIPIALLVGACLLGGLTPPAPGALRGVPRAALARGFLYRCSFVLLAAVLVCEVATGKGALSFFELETGVGEVGEIEAFTLFVGLLWLCTSEEEGGGAGVAK